MESFIAIGIISTIVGVIGYAIWIAANSWRPNLKKEEAIWQRLAKSQKLTFTPSGNLPDTFVTGSYRGHFLSLRTLENDTTGEMQTRVSLNRKQPVADKTDLQILDELAKLVESQTLKGCFEIEANGSCIIYEQPGVETDIAYLRNIFNLLDELITIYPQVIKLGGEVIPALKEIGQGSEAFRQPCVQMIKDIAQETTQRLSEQISELWCPGCLTQLRAMKINFSKGDNAIYYGCRTCGQSREFLRLPQGVVAVLNNGESAKQIQQDGLLKVNWTSRRELFDFNQVEIIQASDEEVERFAVQVGNDTDEWRRSHYAEIECVISPSCALTANTERILQSILGKVIRSNI